MNWTLWILPFAALLFASCAQLGGMAGGKKKEPVNDPYGLGAYRAAGGRVSGIEAAQGGITGIPTTSAGAAAAGITAEEDIVWAPEDPNKPIDPGLEELWKKPESQSWQTSYTEASRLSRESGKPMLIWFTDSMHSPLCRRLSDELFSKSEFDGWAAERLVRLRVDSTVPAKERFKDIGTRKREYIKKLKKRFNVLGHPTVLVLAPSGKIEKRLRGYKKGDADGYWAKLKHAVTAAEEEYGAWREKLEARGYRLWTSRSGRKVFAKLYRFQGRK